MIYEQRCSKCGEKMKKIPIKRQGLGMTIEYYCDKCNESIIYYPDKDIFASKKANLF